MSWGVVGRACAVLLAAGVTACEQEHSLSADAREKLADGQWSLLRVLRSWDDGMPLWVVALRDPEAGSGTLELIPIHEGGAPCAVGSAAEVWIPGEEPAMEPPYYGAIGVVPQVRIGRFENLDASGHGSLSFFDLECATHPPAMSDVHHALHLLVPSWLGATLAQTRDGELWDIDPQRETEALLAQNVTSWQLTSQHIWTLEQGAIVRRSREAPRATWTPFGEGARNFFVVGRAPTFSAEPHDLWVIYEDGEGIRVRDVETGASELVHPGACRPSEGAGLVLGYSPCGPEASLVVHSLGSAGATSHGEGVYAAAAYGWHRQRHILYATGTAEAPEALYRVTLPGPPVQLAVGLTVPNRVWVDGGDVYMADTTDGRWLGRWSESEGLEVLATGVVEVHRSPDWLFDRTYVLANFDGVVGDLYVLEGGQAQLSRIARRVPAGSLRVHFFGFWAGFLSDFEGTERGGTLRMLFVYDNDFTSRVDEGVTAFELTMTPGAEMPVWVATVDFVYTIGRGSRAGIWVGRYDMGGGTR
jgi:hypothetical protein